MAVKAKDFKKFLDPEVLSKIKTLELRARMIVEGFMVGLHRSPYHGFSAEFSEHRPYMQGDSLKNVDWKVFAKSEKYFIKQFEEETNLICNLFIDMSNSMSYRRDGKMNKLDYAVNLAAAISYVLINQQDAVGMMTYSDKIHTYLPPRANKVYLKNILTSLANIKPAGSTSTSRCLNEAVLKIRQRGLIIIFSAFFDDIELIIGALKQLHFKKNEIIVFQILDPVEKSFGFDKDALFIDLESNEQITSQPYQIQKAYQQAMNEYLHRMKNECLNLGIQYNLIETNQPFDIALMNFINKREKLH